MGKSRRPPLVAETAYRPKTNIKKWNRCDGMCSYQLELVREHLASSPLVSEHPVSRACIGAPKSGLVPNDPPEL